MQTFYELAFILLFQGPKPDPCTQLILISSDDAESGVLMCQAHSWIYCRSCATVALRILYGRMQQKTHAMPNLTRSRLCESIVHRWRGCGARRRCCLCLNGGPLRTQLRTLRGLGKERVWGIDLPSHSPVHWPCDTAADSTDLLPWCDMSDACGRPLSRCLFAHSQRQTTRKTKAWRGRSRVAHQC